MAGGRAAALPRSGVSVGVRLRALQTALFVALCLFTLTTGDGGPIAPFVLSALVLLVAAAFLWNPPTARLQLYTPGAILLAMTLYGVVQTLFFRQKITYNGWTGVLFWLTASAIAGLSFHLFRNARDASRFRHFFIVFGTLVCVLDLLQQASHTNKYFWFIPSRYDLISGPFAYWNNFAQFVELLVPVTLWRGLGGGRPALGYLTAAAIQIGAVVASGSRAGTALVLLELIVLIAFAYGRNRNKTLLAGAGIAIVLSTVFVYAAGFEALIPKLQQNDQLAVRRNIDRSSLSMIRTRPLTGWGLNTYVPVYRMFARYDDGTYVNRAHNDWLEWAAEGGIFFSGAMLAIFVWSIRPAIRTGWGIGLIAVCLHALVDYPFARFGVCGWYFCLLGMLGAARSRVLENRVAGSCPVDASLGLRPASRGL